MTNSIRTAKDEARYEHNPAYDYNGDLDAAENALDAAYIALKAARAEYKAAYLAARTLPTA